MEAESKNPLPLKIDKHLNIMDTVIMTTLPLVLTTSTYIPCNGNTSGLNPEKQGNNWKPDNAYAIQISHKNLNNTLNPN
jgi:hypothetical protein